MGDQRKRRSDGDGSGKSGLAACYAAGVAAGMTIADIYMLTSGEYEAVMKEIAAIWKT